MIFREIIYSIKNFIAYFNIIRKDRDWDFFYTNKLLEFKLEKVLKYSEKYTVNNVESGWWQVKYLKLAIKMIKKINSDDFSDKDFWKDDKFYSVPFNTENSKEQLFELKIDSKHTNEERTAQYNKEYKYQEKYIKLFWKIMERRSRTWWD